MFQLCFSGHSIQLFHFHIGRTKLSECYGDRRSQKEEGVMDRGRPGQEKVEKNNKGRKL